MLLIIKTKIKTFKNAFQSIHDLYKGFKPKNVAVLFSTNHKDNTFENKKPLIDDSLKDQKPIEETELNKNEKPKTAILGRSSDLPLNKNSSLSLKKETNYEVNKLENKILGPNEEPDERIKPITSWEEIDNQMPSIKQIITNWIKIISDLIKKINKF